MGILRGGQLKAVERISGLTRAEFRWVTLRLRDTGRLPSKLSAVPGVADVSVNGDTIRLRLNGDFDPLLRALNDNAEAFMGLLQTMPPILLQVFGAADVAVYAVMAGLNITVNEEEAGILDMLLSLPVPRWRVIVERFAAYTLITTGVIASGFAGLWFGSQLNTLDMNTGWMLAGSVNLLHHRQLFYRLS